MSDVEQWEHDEQRAMENEIISLREQVEFWQKEAAGRRDDMANYTRIVSETIDRLNVEVSKLTKERDIKEHCITQFELEDLRMKEQLSTLAEQNAKMRKVLLRLACLGNGDQYGNSIGNCIAQEALSLPDLASPVLNRIRADGMRMASTFISLVRNGWASAGDNLSVQAAEYLISALDALAAELEKTNG